MNRRNFFRALSALAALPLVPKFLKAQPASIIRGYLDSDEKMLYLWKIPNSAEHPWDIERYDSISYAQWVPGYIADGIEP